jgi:hypothetical protein
MSDDHDSMEFLARRNAKGINPESVGRSTKVTFTPAHYSAACTGVSDIAQALLDAHICGDGSQFARLLSPRWKVIGGEMKETNGLFSDIFNDVLNLALERKWRDSDRGKDRLRALTELAIVQVVNEPVCKKCKGTRYDEELKLCKSCKGTGKRKINGSVTANRLDMSESSWSRTWHPRYCEIVALIETIEHTAARKICYQAFSEG